MFFVIDTCIMYIYPLTSVKHIFVYPYHPTTYFLKTSYCINLIKLVVIIDIITYRSIAHRRLFNIQYIALETNLKHSGSDIISINWESTVRSQKSLFILQISANNYIYIYILFISLKYIPIRIRFLKCSN